jgi:hypothetical protein
MLTLIEQLVTTAVSKVPADIRQAEANSLRASMQKALAIMGNPPEDAGWTERVLRRMAEQYTTWQGQSRRSHGR